MKNFQISGEYWVSRSCAVVAIIIVIGSHGSYILANKRGEGCPDFVGYWNMPCGYIDYGETAEEAAARETFEETGVKISPEFFNLLSIDSNPKGSNVQNITIRYRVVTNYEIIKQITNENNTDKETTDIKLINLSEINNYKWAFGHEKLIKKYAIGGVFSMEEI